MIFVTVGTHEQPFDRLIKEVDRLKGCDEIKDEIVMQIGYSTYKPQYCEWHEFLSYNEMDNYNSNADVVITHGGPASFIAPLRYGKIPIVVPRQFKYNEHINNHQLDFCRKVKKKFNNIILVEDIDDLKREICDYSKNDTINAYSNNGKFCSDFIKIVDDLFK